MISILSFHFAHCLTHLQSRQPAGGAGAAAGGQPARGGGHQRRPSAGIPVQPRFPAAAGTHDSVHDDACARGASRLRLWHHCPEQHDAEKCRGLAFCFGSLAEQMVADLLPNLLLVLASAAHMLLECFEASRLESMWPYRQCRTCSYIRRLADCRRGRTARWRTRAPRLPARWRSGRSSIGATARMRPEPSATPMRDKTTLSADSAASQHESFIRQEGGDGAFGPVGTCSSGAAAVCAACSRSCLKAIVMIFSGS